MRELTSSTLVGALGNSITYGVGSNRSWLQFVESSLGVRTVNGAVRASSADFAALCYDEIWNGRRTAPAIDIAVIDYTYTSSVGQLAALVDRLRALPKPPIVLRRRRSAACRRASAGRST